MRGSVITVHLNETASLRKLVERLQNLPADWEHVIQDGGSEGGRPGWLAVDDRIRWESRPDSGIAEAMNRAIARAKGKWFWFLQSDDLPTETGLAKLPQLAGKAPGLHAHAVALDSRPPRTLRPRPEGGGWKLPAPHQGWWVHRDLFEHYGNYDESLRIGMDFEWLARAWREGLRWECHPETIATMAPDGLGSRTDWAGLRTRMKEEIRIRERHRIHPVTNRLLRGALPLYLTCHYIKGRLARAH